jgi:integral membrane protein
MAYNNFVSPKHHVRLSGWLEGISFLVLLGIAMPLKYMAGMPEAVRVVGTAHGALFVWYVLSVLLVKWKHAISNGHTALALAASFLPFGTFYADKKVFRLL